MRPPNLDKMRRVVGCERGDIPRALRTAGAHSVTRADHGWMGESEDGQRRVKVATDPDGLWWWCRGSNRGDGVWSYEQTYPGLRVQALPMVRAWLWSGRA